MIGHLFSTSLRTFDRREITRIEIIRIVKICSELPWRHAPAIALADASPCIIQGLSKSGKAKIRAFANHLIVPIYRALTFGPPSRTSQPYVLNYTRDRDRVSLLGHARSLFRDVQIGYDAWMDVPYYFVHIEGPCDIWCIFITSTPIVGSIRVNTFSTKTATRNPKLKGSIKI